VAVNSRASLVAGVFCESYVFGGAASSLKERDDVTVFESIKVWVWGRTAWRVRTLQKWDGDHKSEVWIEEW
jgi:hypothetical protein